MSGNRGVSRDAVLIALIAAAASLIYALTDRQHVDDDTPDYVIAAFNLASGRGLSRTEPPLSAGAWHFTPRDNDWMLNDIQGDVETGRTPVYPAFLAIFRLLNLDPAAAVAAQHVLRVLISAAAYALALRITERRPIAIFTGLWIAVDPHGLWAANHIVTETLFTAILLVAVFLTVTAVQQRAVSLRPAAAIGLLCALATLTRPVAIAWPAVVALAMLFVRRRAAVIIVVVVTSVVPLLAWSARNQRATGIFTVSLISSMSKVFFTAAGAEAMKQPGDFEEHLHRLRREYRERVTRAASRLGRPITPSEKLALYNSEANRVLKSNIRGALRHAAWRLRLMFIPVYRCTSCGLRGYAKDVLFLLHAAALVFSAIGFMVLVRRDRPSAMFLATTIVYFAVVTSAAGASGARFRVPLEPYYALFIATGVVAIADRWRARGKRA